MEDDKKLQDILTKFGMTLCEFEAMSCPYYGMPFSPKDMAIETVFEIGGKPGESFTADDYLDAIKAMIEKKWLTLITKEECNTRKRTRSDLVEREDDFKAQRGDVVFTEQGYVLLRSILQEYHGRKFVQEHDAFERIHPKTCRIEFYAETKELCHEWLFKNCQQANTSYLSNRIGGPVEIIAVELPQKIGTWKPSRFLTLQHGYRCGIRYRRLKRRRLTFSEFELQATIEEFTPVYISGTIAGFSFSFSDTVGWTCPSTRTSIIESDECAVFSWVFHVDGEPTMIVPEHAKLHDEPLPKGGYGMPNRLFVLEEKGIRRTMLSLKDAKNILKHCCQTYQSSRR